jgi:hypothetical protein
MIAVGAFVALSMTSLLSSRTDAYSDWIGIYARIDKVVLEPDPSAPQRIQIWGAFALASKQDRNSYEKPQRGYLYYSLAPGKEEVCRKEWADLKTTAGTEKLIGFGSRSSLSTRVRKPEDTPADPDLYRVGWGLVKMNDRGSNYPPFVELRAAPRSN